MQTKLYNQSGEVIGDVDLPDRVFGLKPDHDLINQALVTQRANSRRVIAHVKDRGEVSGGGRKPWRQKGTGRARHGSIRSPLWRGGGVTFGPASERNFSRKINQQTRRKSILMVLSGKAKERRILVLGHIDFAGAKTKEADRVFKILSEKIDQYRFEKNKRDKILLVTDFHNQNVQKAVDNLPFIKVIEAKNLNVADLLTHKFVFLVKEAISVIEKTFD